MQTGHLGRIELHGWVVWLGIQLARDTLQFFVKLTYYASFVCFDVLQLIKASDPDPVIQNIQYYLGRMSSEFAQFFQTVGDIAYQIIMTTGKLGQALQSVVNSVCNFLSNVFMGFVRPMLCAIKDGVLAVMGAVQSVAGALNTFLGGALNGFDNTVQAVTNKISTGFDCNMSNPFNCQGLFPADADLPSALPMPTRCWVGFQPTLGDQTNLGCTAADTCVGDDQVTLVACAACQGTTYAAAYGCSAVTKLCQCNVPPLQTDACSSNADCQLSSMSCDFVDNYLQPTFGTVPCTSCSQQSFCLVTGGTTGSCSCPLVAITPDTCQPTDLAQLVTPDPTQACLVSLGLSQSHSNSYSADFNALAMAPCSVLNGGTSYCLTVYLTASTSAPMIVGLSLLSARRRLLALATTPPHPHVNRSEWRRAHEPCRSLMLANDSIPMGPTDAYARSECERWHAVGAVAIALHNLSALQPVAFTSPQSLLEALMDAEAARQVAACVFRLAPFLAAQTHVAQPLAVVARHLWAQLRPALNRTARYWEGRAAHLVPKAHARLQELLPFYHMVVEEGMPNVTAVPDTANEDMPNVTAVPNTSHRRLLQTSWKDELAAVQSLSVAIVDGATIPQPTTDTIATDWNTGPFAWPPTYDYWSKTGGSSCVLASIVWNVSMFTAQTTASYYASDFDVPPVARTFSGCMPALTAAPATPPPAPSNPTWTGAVFRACQSALEAVGLGTTPLLQYLASNATGDSEFAADVKALATCDFRSVQLCTQFKRSLGWGGLVVGLGFVLASVVARYLCVPYVDMALAAWYIPVVLMYVFGVSPLCFPLVPTCLLLELQLTVEAVLPVHLTWPDQLQAWPGCVDGAPRPPDIYILNVSPGTASCFVNCAAFPFGYQSYENTLAWAVLNVAPGFATSSAAWIQANWGAYAPFTYGLVDLDAFARDVQTKQAYLAWPDMATSQTVCCALTGINLLPLVLGLGAVVGIALSVLALPFIALQAVSSVLLSLLAYIHTR